MAVEAAVTAALASWVKWVPGWAGPADRLAAVWAAERGRAKARWRGPMAATQAALRRCEWAAGLGHCGRSGGADRRSQGGRAAGCSGAARPGKSGGCGARWLEAPGLRPDWRRLAWRSRRNARAAASSLRRPCTAGGAAPPWTWRVIKRKWATWLSRERGATISLAAFGRTGSCPPPPLPSRPRSRWAATTGPPRGGGGGVDGRRGIAPGCPPALQGGLGRLDPCCRRGRAGRAALPRPSDGGGGRANTAPSRCKATFGSAVHAIGASEPRGHGGRGGACRAWPPCCRLHSRWEPRNSVVGRGRAARTQHELRTEGDRVLAQLCHEVESQAWLSLQHGEGWALPGCGGSEHGRHCRAP